jgi:hypothetical protein
LEEGGKMESRRTNHQTAALAVEPGGDDSRQLGGSAIAEKLDLRTTV